MKKVVVFMMSLCLMASMALSAAAIPYGGATGRLDKYHYEPYMYPTWAGDAVFQELTVFYVDGDGNTQGGALLYKPDSMISVRSFDLKTEYKEGEDYVMTEKGIALTENTSIPVMPRSAYCNEADLNYTHQLKDGNGGALITDNNVLPKYYLSVSYTTSEAYTGTIPKSEIDRLTRLKTKLENKEPVTIAALGDSITVGYTTSGLNDPSYRVNGEQITCVVNFAPYMPTWPKLLCEALKKAYGYDDITVVNWGVGGSNTVMDCIHDMVDRVISSEPDLVTIGFGMNEYWCPANQHGDRVEGIMETILESVPKAEFLLLSSMLPNMLAYNESNMQLASFEKEYYTIQKERTDLHIAVAPLNTVYIEAREIKGDLALLGGNQNHPNDFTARLYAQTVAAALGVYETPILVFDAMTEGEVGKSLSIALDNYCEADAMTWSVVDGKLPEGVTLNDGVLSGTPTAPGTYTFTVKAENGTRSHTRIMELNVTGEAPSESTAPVTEKDLSSGSANKSNLPLILTAIGAILAVAATAVISSIAVKKATKK